ncbi:hypothetical protein [Cellulomonas wangsupingiae]|uniref:hypothetical protein n=1 Tax=Cellulomonas wangsupingiae TaxID=2968085 RepID=UPI001D0E2ED4|nr:hypothetical protein [Cellulomonas wangsupingiae]MCM0638578.1 hypothetical protein [Cellulomonas wangsupingiae]
MRRALALLTALLGGLLVLVGTAVAVVAGPDDIAHLPTRALPGDVGTALLPPGLLAWDGVTVAVRATGSDGGVFLGSAHPVDAESYLSGVGTFRADEITWQGVWSGRQQEGDLAAPAAAPGGATFWTDRADGAGTRQLLLPLSGQPVAVVAVATAAEGADGGAPAPSGSLRMTMGVRVPHAFASGVATAALGAVLIAVAFLVGRRRPCPADGAEPASATGPTPAADLTAVRRVVATATGAAVLTSLTGCAAVPERVELGEIRRVAIDADEVAAALASYDERNAAANALSHQHDPSGWAAADTGAVLAGDLYVTAWTAASGETPTSTTSTTSAGRVYAPDFATYPTWFLAETIWSAEGEESVPRLTVFERATVLDPWRLSAAVDVAAEVPAPRAPGAASTASDEARARAVETLAVVERFVESGDGTGLEPGPLAELRTAILGDDGEATSTLDVQNPAAAEDPTGPGGSVRVVAVEGGTLVTSTHVMIETVQAQPDHTISFVDEVFAQVMGMTGDRETLVLPMVLSVALLLLDDGTTRVLGADFRYRLP